MQASMPGLGTIVNFIAIILGSLVGLLLKKGVPDRFQKIIFTGTGTGVFLIGITGVMAAALTASQSGQISSRWGLLLILSLVIGGVIGEALRIDRAFDAIGKKLQGIFAKNQAGSGVSTGFTLATILFCSGAMAIIGAIEDAGGNPDVLFTKSIIDCISALIFTTVYGVGVIFSAASVLIYQGLITVLAIWLTPYIPAEVITMISFVGNSILLLISFSLWDIKKFNVANLIPAAFMPIILYLIPFLR